MSVERKTTLDYRIAENLKFLRRINDLSQEDLAKVVGYSFRTISKWEVGESVPSYENLQALSAFFDISIDDLMEKDLSKLKGRMKFSSKLVDNRNNFLLLQQDVYKCLFERNDDEISREFLFKNGLLIPANKAFSDKVLVLLRKEHLTLNKATYILNQVMMELRKNSLIDYYDLLQSGDKIIVKYKISL